MAAIRLRDLEIFNTVMQVGIVTEAARLLHVSQPAISKALKDMEANLGIKLFVRKGGRLLVPTPEATMLHREVSPIFTRVSSVERLVRELRDTQFGNIVVAAGPTLAHTHLPLAIARFRDSHPNVGITVKVLHWSEIMEATAKREVDFGVLYDWPSDDRLTTEQFATAEIGCVMPRDHPLVAKKFIGPADLVGQQIISYEEHVPLGGYIVRSFEQAGVPKPEIAIRVGFSLTAFFLLRTTGGVALIDPALLMSRAFPELTLRPFRPRIEVGMQVCTAYGVPLSRAAGRLIEFLKEVAAEDERTEVVALSS